MVRSLTVACTVWFSSTLDSNAVAQEPTCGCETSPVCDGGCGHTQRKKPKSLSFAEKILKHFDHVGDKIEAESRHPTTRGWTLHRRTAHCGVEANCDVEANCGVETAPSCGCEPMPTGCDCPACAIQQPMAFAPAIPAQPFTSAYAFPPPVLQRAPSTPMHPNVPVEKQAIGKISDKSSSRSTAPSQPPAQLPVRKTDPIATPKEPLPEAPVQAMPMPQALNEPLDAPKPIIEKAEPTAPISSPLRSEKSPEPFQPRFPKGTTDAPSLRDIPSQLNPPKESTESVLETRPVTRQPASQLPSSGLPPANLSPGDFPPAGLPPASLPSSTGRELPDVLVDPFEDDVTWQGKRRQMNGIRLTVGPGNTNPASMPALEKEPTKLKSVPPEELEQSLPIILTPAGPASSGKVVPTSFSEQVPVRVNQAPKAKVIHFKTSEELGPSVKRVAVPATK